MCPATTRLLRRLPSTDCQTWNVLKRQFMFGSTRHVLKYHHLVARLPDLPATGLHCRSYSKSTPTGATPVSKRTVTKKKYSELPALHPQSETISNTVRGSEIASNTHLARYPRIPECMSFASPGGCMLTWLCASFCTAEISNLSSTDSQPLPLYGPTASLESCSTQRARRRHVRRNDNAEETSIPESTKPPNSTPLAPNVAVRQKRGKKAPQTQTGESCE